MENFDKYVYDIVERIPYGKVTSYGAIAESISTSKSSRLVGWIMSKCPKNLPAHRVVNRNGLLTGKYHFEDENTMQVLLESEGIKIIDNKVVDFKKHFWNPKTEL